ncbi:MAG: SpoIID/LytB domain-containing protein [Nocardioides sp.]|nr:SpoIID/LytB domain-containing protein [Nocardioides sp.]
MRSPFRLLTRTAGTVAAATLALIVPLAAVPAAADETGSTLPSSFVLSGSGWGHGVGLSQYGAQAMAQEGRTEEQILEHYYRGTQVGTNRRGRTFDVNVRYQPSTFTASLRALRPDAVLEVCAMRGGRCAKAKMVVDRTADASPEGRVLFRRTSTGVRAFVTNAKGRTSRVAGERIRLRWTGTKPSKGPASVLRLDTGREYRHGQAFVVPSGSSTLNGLVRVRLQPAYLRGIAEMPSSWDPAALRAQAIIARTYALRTGATRKDDCGCHLRDSVIHQVYAGWQKENEGTNATFGKRWVSAVKATRGQVLRYGGDLAQTFYYSSSGGNTLNSEDVWSASVPYLRSVPDPWSVNQSNPNRTWTSSISQRQAQQLFGLKKVQRIEVTGRHQGGGLRELTAYGPKRTKRISGKADTMRIRLGLKSAWVAGVRARS